MERPPLRCLGAFLALDRHPMLLRSLLALLGVPVLAKDGPAIDGVFGPMLDACAIWRRADACLYDPSCNPADAQEPCLLMTGFRKQNYHDKGGEIIQQLTQARRLETHLGR